MQKGSHMQDLQELKEIWSLAIDELSKKHSKIFMTVWINDLRLIYLDDKIAHFYCPSDLKRSMLLKNHIDILTNVMKLVLGYSVEVFLSSDTVHSVVPGVEMIEKVRYSYDDEEASPVREESSESNSNDREESNHTEPVHEATYKQESEQTQPYENPFAEREAALNIPTEDKPTEKENFGIGDPPHWSDYKFENFIVGSSNKFAYAACTAVAKKPAHAYNPLFIYGPSGLGKTHLLYAITNEIQKNNPEFNIIYIKGEEFTNQMIESIARGTTKKFRERYRKADVLLIDDVHFIAGKDSTQEEFFHTFNDLYEHKKQIILTSDRPVKDIQHLEERLRTRFQWGLTADIQPPDFELRVAIMKNKAESLGKSLSDDVLNLLSEKLTSNIRQMEGAIKKIIAYSYLSGEEITAPLALSCISDLLSENAPVRVTPEQIVTKVGAKYGVDVSDIYTKKRTNDISRARHTCIYLLRKVCDMTYPKIAKLFDRDHATIMSSYKVIEKEIKNNSAFELEINELIKEITGA